MEVVTRLIGGFIPRIPCIVFGHRGQIDARAAEVVVHSRAHRYGVPSNLGRLQHQLGSLSFCSVHHSNVVNGIAHYARVVVPSRCVGMESNREWWRCSILHQYEWNSAVVNSASQLQWPCVVYFAFWISWCNSHKCVERRETSTLILHP